MNILDFVKKNRTLITQGASALAGFAVIMLNAFVKTPLTPEQTKALEYGCMVICGGFIYFENYIQNRDHKANVKKIENGGANNAVQK